METLTWVLKRVEIAIEQAGGGTRELMGLLAHENERTDDRRAEDWEEQR